MSTAILHAGSFIHDFNDIVMKVSLSASSTYRRAEFFFMGTRHKKKAARRRLATSGKKEWRQEFEKHMFCFHNVFFLCFSRFSSSCYKE